MKFAVSIITPSNYEHSEAFREVGETINYGLLSLGYDSVLTSLTDCPDRQHIVLGSNLLSFYQTMISAHSIFYNLEQVKLDSPWLQPALLDLFREYPVWDYSQRNIEQLTKIGITHVQHVPIGYVPQLTRIPQAHEDIDVLFFGSINERRWRIIQSLQDYGLKTEAVFGVYGSERDGIIARSKIVLNMHFYEAKVFEIVRVSYLLSNQRFVVSERGSDPAEEAAFSAGVVFADYDELAKTCLYFISLPEDRRRIAAAGFDLMVQRSETTYLKSALQSFVP